LLKKKLFIYITVITLTLTACLITVFRYSLPDTYSSNKAAFSYYGSSGQEVIDIQAKLYNWGYYNGIVDGVFGYQTYKAVRYFQSKNGLTVDGIVGPVTLSALGLPSGQSSVKSSSSISPSKDADLLARLIYGEARGEPYIGQVAVASVILNRTRDSRFPKTIAGVIYQPGAFDAVSDGQINLEPDNNAYNAANDALNGWDPSYGCIYYYNPATATSSWIWSRPIIIKIGNHNFAK
jgi:N-acetylmuramoyl-L-alanine amidase